MNAMKKTMTHVPAGDDPQAPFDAAVVMPTVLRPKLLRAAKSIFGQRDVGRVQVLIGVDEPIGEYRALDQVRAACPDHCAVTVLDLGYSTAAHHGGLHGAYGGGALRTVLTLAANSRHVAYLDDDNWWDEDHLASLLDAVRGKDWAFSLRWLVNPYTDRVVCLDEWDSVGPGAGVFAEQWGGFVDPNCLLVDVPACLAELHRWCLPLKPEVSNRWADRSLFNALKSRPNGATGKATAYYGLPVDDPDGEDRIAIYRRMTEQAAT